MRITNQMMINSTMSNIQINKQQLSTLDTQLSTQKKINKPSEDPIIAIRALRLRSSLNQVTQYLNKNIPDANSWLDTTQSALDEANSIITNLYEYCTQGSTDSYSSAERNTIAESLNKLKDAFYAQGDVEYAGRYVFTGYKTDTPLTYQSDAEAADVDFTITQQFGREDISTKTIYTNAYSNEDIINLNVKTDATTGNLVTPDTTTVHRLRTGYNGVKDTGFTMTYNNTDIAIDKDGKTATVTTYKLDASGKPQVDTDGNKIVNETKTVDIDADGKFQVTDSAGKPLAVGTTTDKNANPSQDEILFNAATGELLLGENAYKQIYSSDSFSFTYKKDNFLKGDLNPTMYYHCVDNNTGVTYDKSTENIEYNINFSQKLKVNSEASDAFNMYLGRDIDDLVTSVQNVIDLENQMSKVKDMMKEDQYSDETSQSKLSSMLEGLTKQKELAEEQMTNTFENGVGQMKEYQQQVSLAKADVGNRITRLNLTKSRLTEQKTNFTSLKSENEDIDLEEVVVGYSSAELVYNASLTAASKIVQRTLLDFL
jgi:flagellar hook-associated protein 3 FlgL